MLHRENNLPVVIYLYQSFDTVYGWKDENKNKWSVHMYAPGEAHISKTMSPGWGFKTCPTTTEGKFWRNSMLGSMSLNEGHL